MTVEQAQQILAGNPTQEELLTALLVLAENDETAYVAALPRAVELLSQMPGGQGVTKEQIDTTIRTIQAEQAQPQDTQEVTLGETEAAPTTQTVSPQSEVDELVRGVQDVPGVPVEEEETPEFQPPPFIGNVPEGYGASVVSHPAQPVETVGGPQYRAGDEWDPARLSPREIRRQQKELEKAGLLEPGSYIPGFWDKASADALNNAMGYANIQGVDVEDILEEMASLRPSQRDADQFMPPPEVKPDPATIAQRVKREFRSQLGRDPTDSEMAEFAGYLRGQYAAEHEFQTELERAAFDAEPPTPEQVVSHPAQPVETVGGEGETPGPFTAVDREARFRERFEARFGPEIDRLAALPEVRENMNNVFASLRTMGSLVG